MSVFFKKLKQVKISDFLHFFLFFFAIIPAFFVRIFNRDLWLVCEYGLEARDNGFWFYKYVRENHPTQPIVYAIKKKSIDYDKVAALGKTVEYGSLNHWIYYLAADKNISSHKGGKPNAAVCYFLEIYGFLKNKRVFLQHGITKDLADMFFYKNTKMRLFICGAKPEYDYVTENFGYPLGYVAYTGFARFDRLYLEKRKEKVILVAPTWRRWLYQTSSDPYENSMENVENSEYVKAWKEVLSSSAMEEILKKYGYKIVFFPHRNMTSIFENMSGSDYVDIVNWKNTDLQDLLINSEFMITDYSSTAMDFAYMDKALVYYQFDYDEFREKHFEEGYFNYENNGFGPVCYNLNDLINKVEEMICQKQDLKYKDRISEFFPMRDANNCKRIYDEVKGI